MRYIAPFLLLLAVLPFYYRAWSGPGFGISHDDGIYLATAKALATGQGYTLISLPEEIKQTKYPILFPLLLAFVWRIEPAFPANLGLLKLIPLLATAAWLIAVYRLARELAASRLWALWVTVCVMANPWVISFSGLLRSESLFAALSTWAVVFLLRAERSGQLRPVLWAALLAGASYHTRTAAVAVIAAGCAGLLLARHFRLALVFGALTAGICLPWIIWQAQQTPLPPVERYYTALCYREENILSFFSLHEKATILSENLRQILIVPFPLFGFPRSAAGFLGCLLFWQICILGVLRIRNRCVQCAIVASMLMPCLWAWAPERFLVPGLGLLLIAAHAAFRGRYAKIGALAVFVAVSAVTLYSFVAEARKTQLFSIDFVKYPATWPEVLETLNWIRHHVSQRDVVVSSIDPMVYFYTGVKSIRGFYVDSLPVYYGLPAHANSEQEFLRTLHRYHPAYVLEMRPDFFETRFMGAAISKFTRMGFLAEVKTVGAMHVYKVLGLPPWPQEANAE